MTNIGVFPFGKPVQILIQENRTPKKVFILGVYASAVHARWIDSNSKELVKALAVASEPYIFWRGENAESIIRNIGVPEGCGKLEPADSKFNGPSGIALDDLILKPLGLEREDAWLCDLVPHSCMNSDQEKAIKREYLPRIGNKLPTPSVPFVPRELTDDKRVSEILSELRESKAEILVLLGNEPIKWFLHKFDERTELSEFGYDQQSYGKTHSIQISGVTIDVLPLAHPRQIARLGKSSSHWYKWHQVWIENRAPELRKKIK